MVQGEPAGIATGVGRREIHGAYTRGPVLASVARAFGSALIACCFAIAAVAGVGVPQSHGHVAAVSESPASQSPCDHRHSTPGSEGCAQHWCCLQSAAALVPLPGLPATSAVARREPAAPAAPAARVALRTLPFAQPPPQLLSVG
jgi:hypothetical protein